MSDIEHTPPHVAIVIGKGTIIVNRLIVLGTALLTLTGIVVSIIAAIGSAVADTKAAKALDLAKPAWVSANNVRITNGTSDVTKEAKPVIRLQESATGIAVMLQCELTPFSSGSPPTVVDTHKLLIQFDLPIIPRLDDQTAGLFFGAGALNVNGDRNVIVNTFASIGLGQKTVTFRVGRPDNSGLDLEPVSLKVALAEALSKGPGLGSADLKSVVLHANLTIPTAPVPKVDGESED